MSHLSPPSHTHRKGPHEQTVAHAPPARDDSSVETWDDDLREELERLAVAHRNLLASVISRPSGEGDELTRLRAENADLRRRVGELEQHWRPVSGAEWEEQQKEFEALLEEKSEVIRDLHHKIAELREAVTASRPAPAAASEPIDPNVEQDILRLRRELEEQRIQLKQDEEALEQQMKQMELVMARERAELARQRVELQRLHNDLRHEMEQAARDTGLRERLMPLQRRQQDVTGRRAVATMTDISIPEDEPSLTEPKRQNSGVLRKLFGS
ncbi:MAG: hypothetical protein L0Z62_15010 [Gemmataceae bacterium]|nr:hypothetical protein [Gemmataceae bacterium]